jgi:hypothetical protein
VIKKRNLGMSIALLAVVALLPISTFAAKPPGTNPYPATSAAICAKYGGDFTDFGGGSKQCVVNTSTSATYYHAEGQVGKGGGWTITQVINTTYTLDQGTREVTGTSEITCTNPGGKDMTNTWIHPCLPSSYPISVP